MKLFLIITTTPKFSLDFLFECFSKACGWLRWIFFRRRFRLSGTKEERIKKTARGESHKNYRGLFFLPPFLECPLRPYCLCVCDKQKECGERRELENVHFGVIVVESNQRQQTVLHGRAHRAFGRVKNNNNNTTRRHHGRTFGAVILCPFDQVPSNSNRGYDGHNSMIANGSSGNGEGRDRDG